jgi:hypothetical protein
VVIAVLLGEEGDSTVVVLLRGEVDLEPPLLLVVVVGLVVVVVVGAGLVAKSLVKE